MTHVAGRLSLAAVLSMLVVPFAGAQSRVQTGVLECLSNPSVGAIVGSVRTMTCVFKPAQGLEQHYSGTRTRIGLDVGVQAGLGVGANALVGGSNNTVTLQPLSVEGQVGVSVALGVSALTLTFLP